MRWRHPRMSPPWYFLDHSSEPNLRIATNLYKIDVPGLVSGRRAVVFEAARDIKAGEWLTFFYQRHEQEWCCYAPCSCCR